MTKPASSGTLSLCRLRKVQKGTVTLLDAVATRPGQAELFFTHDTPLEAIAAGPRAEIVGQRTLGGSPMVTVRWSGPLVMLLNSAPVTIHPTPPETGLFAGRDVALALRNGERADLALDWLRYHHRTHGLNGAVILDRDEPGGDPTFVHELEAGLLADGPDCTVLVVMADHPLGHKDQPAETHPYSVPEAPGKDRMEVPPANPWHAPFAEVILYEWARARYLGSARAVANFDVHDLLTDAPGPSVFDRAAASPSGYVAMAGRHCYPWRIRNGDKPDFSDHACVQFDAQRARRRWCVAPDTLTEDSMWRAIRVGGAVPDPDQIQPFYRCMALRHRTSAVSRIVPKSSLIAHPPLIEMLGRHFETKPVLPPAVKTDIKTNGRRAIVTTMKNEGPFILEWIAYHRAIGIDDFLVYTNDCTDGTDTLLDVLQAKGIVQHRDNPYRDTTMKPQHAALSAADSEPVIAQAEWVVCMDVDEFINIKCGDGTLDALFDALGDVNLISMTWRLFGNDDRHDFTPDFVTSRFTTCAPELARKPHQAWGFKTLYRNSGLFKKLGVHRPKGLKPQLWEQIRWVNGSGKPLPRKMYRNAWRSTMDSYGYDLVQLNHYAVRSAESFLVKRERGRVNHVDRDQGLAYWFRMNNNAETDKSIQRMLPRLQAEFDALMQDPDIAAAHNAALAAHRNKIDTLKQTPAYSTFFDELTSARMEKLSRMHAHFGASVFLQGPGAVPQEMLESDLEEPFFFTVKKGEAEH
ncbi:glycosyltransferase family 2 protein [Ruegeria hyattellae]|uniref:glycosyltransferase family 2 protein n=1 Tax=Ruegeria hyattellae TaxID=3233337 RepID=UPI00355C2014